jgi:hypothetical protein
MDLEKLKIKLHNARVWIEQVLGKEPECCGYFRNPDGRLVECDEWWGYQECMFPGCGHYQLEHSDGTPNKIIYAKDNPELVGTLVVDPVGCLNAGCEDCPKFWTKDDLHNFVQQLGQAKRDAYWTLGGWHNDEMADKPPVKRVDVHIDIIIRATTILAPTDEAAREVIFKREQGLMEKYPDVTFDFHVTQDTSVPEE